MEVTLIHYTNGKNKWWSILIDNISIASDVVKDIVGHSVNELELNAHSLYQNGTSFISTNTAKKVFKNLVNDLYKDEYFVMNLKGGYTRLRYVEWEELERKQFGFSYKDNLRDLLLQVNGVDKKQFKEV